MNNTILIGDSLGTDIKGANQIGLKSIWINRDKRINETPNIRPDFEIENFEELDKYI